jgi:hypothetical protein
VSIGLVVLLACLAACTSPSAARDAYTVRDRAGVRWDGGSRELVHLSATGELLPTVARRGRGPGEAQHVSTLLAIWRDTVLIEDDVNGHFTTFVEGTAVAAVAMGELDALRMSLGVVGRDAAGRFLLGTSGFNSRFEEPWLQGHMVVFDAASRVHEHASLELAREAAASLAVAAIRMGDRVALLDLAAHDGVVAAGSGQRHLDRLLRRLSVSAPVGTRLTRRRAPVVPAGSMVYVFTSLLDDEAAAAPARQSGA